MAQVALTVPRKNMQARYIAVMSEFDILLCEFQQYNISYSSMKDLQSYPEISIQPDGIIHPEYKAFVEEEATKERRQKYEDWRKQAMQLMILAFKIKDEIVKMIDLHSLLLHAEPKERVLLFEEVTALNKVHMFSCRLALSCDQVVHSTI